MATGPRIAHKPVVFKDDEHVVLISNTSKVEVIDRQEFPDRYQLEVYSLRRRVEELECLVHDKNDRLCKAIATLEAELLMWNAVMYEHLPETYGQIKRRMIKIQGTLSDLKDLQPRYYPKLEIPEQWKKKLP